MAWQRLSTKDVINELRNATFNFGSEITRMQRLQKQADALPSAVTVELKTTELLLESMIENTNRQIQVLEARQRELDCDVRRLT